MKKISSFINDKKKKETYKIYLLSLFRSLCLNIFLISKNEKKNENYFKNVKR